MIAPRIIRLLALGAFGATGLFPVLFVLLVWATIPRPNSGLDLTETTILWIAFAGIFAALIGVHLVLARQLWDNRPRLP